MQGSAGWYRSKPKPVAITEAQSYPQKESHKKMFDQAINYISEKFSVWKYMHHRWK